MGGRENVLPFRPEGTEIIAGVARALGRMTLPELLELKQECAHQVAEAQTDYNMVDFTIQQRFPGPPEGAA